MIDSYSEKTDEYIHYYVTVVGKSLYYFAAPTSGKALSEVQKADFRKTIDSVTFVRKDPPTEEEERQAAMIRIIKRFAVAFSALAVLVVLKAAFDKIRGTNN